MQNASLKAQEGHNIGKKVPPQYFQPQRGVILVKNQKPDWRTPILRPSGAENTWRL
jgi:hypothetical protein